MPLGNQQNTVSRKRPTEEGSVKSAKLRKTMSEEENIDVPTSSNNFSDNYRPVRPNSALDVFKKKLVIKNFKPKTAHSEANEDGVSEWERIYESIDAILEDKTVDTSLETLFTLVKSATDLHNPKTIYDRLLEVIRIYCVKLRESVDIPDDVPLSEDTCELYIVRFWNVWKVYPLKITLIRNIFIYLDRVLVSHTGDGDTLPLWEATMRTFRTVFFPDIGEDFRTTKLFLALFLDIQRMIQKLDAQGNAVRELLSMLSTIRINDEFMQYLVMKINDTYSNNNLSLPCNEYIKYADGIIQQYNELVDLYFCEPSASRTIFDALIRCLISKSIKQIVSNRFDSLLESDDINDITRMFELLRRVTNGEDIVRAEFGKYIKWKGQKLMETCQDNDLFLELLSFKKRMDEIVLIGFGNSSDVNKFRQSVRDSFEWFMETKGNKAAELIAKYFHGLLRMCNKKATDESLDEMIDDAIVVFRFIRGKDVFEAYYKRDLAKRLLLDRSASVDAEKTVLAKLKTECGAGFTHKLEGMFKDMECSDDLNKLFIQYLDHINKKKTNFNVRVLTSDHWPTYDLYEINLPKELQLSLIDFSDFYKKQHGNRNVNWHYSLSTAVVCAKFRPGYVKELIVSLFHAVVLLLFNKCEQWTVAEIVEATKIEKDEVVRTVLALIGGRGKPRILKKFSDKNEETETTVDSVEKDTFVVNTVIVEKLYRIRIAQVQLKTTKEEKIIIEQEVSQDRQYQIDAAVVRIMKSRKALMHNVLIQEVMAQLQFPVKGADIKLRIGSLIERDYLVRDQDDPNKYNYVS